MKSTNSLFESYEDIPKPDIRAALRKTSRTIGTPGWLKEMAKNPETEWLYAVLTTPEMKKFLKKGSYTLRSTIVQLGNGTLEFTKGAMDRMRPTIFLKSNYLRLLGAGEPRMLMRDPDISSEDYAIKALKYLNEKYVLHGPTLISKAASASVASKNTAFSDMLVTVKKTADNIGISGINWKKLDLALQLKYTKKGDIVQAKSQIIKLNKNNTSGKLIIPILTVKGNPEKSNEQFGNTWEISNHFENESIMYNIILPHSMKLIRIEVDKTTNMKNINLTSNRTDILQLCMVNLEALNLTSDSLKYFGRFELRADTYDSFAVESNTYTGRSNFDPSLIVDLRILRNNTRALKAIFRSHIAGL